MDDKFESALDDEGDEETTTRIGNKQATLGLDRRREESTHDTNLSEQESEDEDTQKQTEEPERTNEDSIQADEDSRQAGEQDGETNEDRIQAEEDIRQAGEEDGEANEDRIQPDEDIRRAGEQDRETNEDRIQADEDIRQAGEQDGETNEDIIQVAEDIRQTGEKTEQTQEEEDIEQTSEEEDRIQADKEMGEVADVHAQEDTESTNEEGNKDVTFDDKEGGAPLGPMELTAEEPKNFKTLSATEKIPLLSVDETFISDANGSQVPEADGNVIAMESPPQDLVAVNENDLTVDLTSSSTWQGNEEAEDDGEPSIISTVAEEEAKQTTTTLEEQGSTTRPSAELDRHASSVPTAPSYIRLSTTSLSFSVRRGFYDEASQALIKVSKQGEIRAVSLRAFTNPSTGKQIKAGDVFASFRYKDKAGHVRISPCCKYVAVFRSQTQVAIIALKTKLETVVECRGRSNAILTNGLIWIPCSMPSPPNTTLAPPCLCLVTTAGLETYTLKAGSASFSYVQSVYVNRAKYYWFLPSRNLLCVATDDGTMYPFAFQPDSPYPEKWAHAQLNDLRFGYGEGALAELYGEPWFLRFRPRETLLYRLTRNGATLVKTVQTSDGFAMGVSVVDSLLVMHSSNTHVSLLYDVRDDTSDLPFTHPLPLGLPSLEDEDVPNPTKKIVPYASTWTFLPPHWVFDARMEKVWSLQLDLRSAAASCSRPISDDPEPLARFLLRRSTYPEDAKGALFERMLEVFEDETDLINQLGYLKVLAESALGLCLVTVSPDEFCMMFLDALYGKVEQPSLCASIGLEYAKFLFGTFQSRAKLQQASLPKSQVPINSQLLPSTDLVFGRIAAWLVKANRAEELYQLCLFRVETDSPDLARTILDSGKGVDEIAWPERRQAGIDCLKRLNDAKHSLRELLKDSKSYMRAVRFAIQSNLIKQDDDTVVELFQVAVQDKRIAIDRLSLLHSALLEHRPQLLREEKSDQFSTPKNGLYVLLKSLDDSSVVADNEAAQLMAGLFRPLS